MKNHWINRKEDRDRKAKLPKFKGKFQEADPMNKGGRMYSQRVWDEVVKEMEDDEWHHVSIQFDGTSSSVHIDDVQIFERALNYQEVLDLYDRERTCKCGKTFKTNVGHTEECLKQLDKDESGFYK